MPTTGDHLAATGADSGLLLWGIAGLGALVAGADSVFIVHRRASEAGA